MIEKGDTEHDWFSRRQLAIDAAFLGVATIAVQGASQLGQLLGVRVLSEHDYAAVRLTESAYAVGLLVAALGTPTIAIRLGALWRTGFHSEVTEKALRHATALSSLVVAASASVLVALSKSSISLWVPISYGLALMPACWTRIRLGTIQGQGQFRAAARATAAISIMGALLSLLGASAFGFVGWAAARVSGELLMSWLVLRMFPMQDRLVALSTGRPLRAAVFTGAPVAAGLAVRSAMDSFALWLAGAWSLGAPAIAAFGLYTLAVSLGALPAGLVGNATLPRLVARSSGRGPNVVLLTGLRLVTTVSALGITGAVVAVGALTSFRHLTAEGGIGLGFIAVVSLLRSYASYFGTTLLAANWQGASLVATCLAAAVGIGLASVRPFGTSVKGAALIVVCAEAFAVVALLVAHQVRERWRRSDGAG